MIDVKHKEPITLPDETWLRLALTAHKRGITLNAFIVEIIEEYIALLDG